MAQHRLDELANNARADRIRGFIENGENGENLVNKGTGMFGYTPLHEAAFSNKYKIIDHLIQQGAKVDIRANNGCTPLHLAASMGHAESVRALLCNNADVTLKDNKGKTAKELAMQTSYHRVVRLIRSEEVVNAAATNEDNLTELLRVKVEELEPNCLERALMAAVEADNHFNIGKLIIKGASRIKEGLEKALECCKYNACAMLLLVLAAQENDRESVLKLFGASNQHPLVSDRYFPEIQKAIFAGGVSTIIAIEIARRHQNHLVREELILHTDVNREEGTVYWHGLRLYDLEISWLRKVHWVKKLRLARNGFRSLPNDMNTYLKQVIKLDLQHNELTTVPHSIFELPSLIELILSHNRLSKIPQNATKWSPGLTVLDLSHNKLTSLPSEISAPSLRTLELSNNHFASVPLSICFFTNLQYLNLSHNKDILTLPHEMGRLVSLNKLILEGLEHCTEPPRSMQKDARDCVRYLDNKFRSPRKSLQMKLLIVGNSNVGKTTLAARLQGQEVDLKQSRSEGINISEWQYSSGFLQQKYTFNIYDFGCLENSSASSITQAFFSNNSIYVLVWKLKHGEKGIAELKPWLDSIATRGNQNSCVIIVGTCLDLIQSEEERIKVDEYLHRISEMCAEYTNKLHIPEVLAVGLIETQENVNVLKKCIYKTASNCKTKQGTPLMSLEVPSNFMRIKKEMKDIQISEVSSGLRPPVMHINQFKSFILALNLPDVVTDEEILWASLFLKDMGNIVYFNDKSYNLDELYFIDPSWLYKFMSAIIKNPSIVNGIIKTADIQTIFQNTNFQWQYANQYLFLMASYGIALPLDSHHILIPSMLPLQSPVNFTKDILQGDENCRYFIFRKNIIPSCFWSRLVAHIIHGIPLVHQTLLSSLKQNICDNNEEHTQTDAKQKFELELIYSGEINEEIDHDEGEVIYWREGIIYTSKQNGSFCVDSYQNSKGIKINATPNENGIKFMCQIIDIIRRLLSDWYLVRPEEFYEEQVPCYECLKRPGQERSFEFKINNILPLITSSVTEVNCEYSKVNPSLNHTVSCHRITPELLLCDLEKDVILTSDSVTCQQDSLIGDGSFAKVYDGIHNSNNNKVAVKVLIDTNIKENLISLRREAQILTKSSQHPFIIKMIGVIYTPYVGLVLEKAPLGSLHTCIIRKNVSVPRIVVYRIATQVAAGLKFLHQNGIVHRNLKASNVLIWSLDLNSFLNAKLADSGISCHLSPFGVTGIQGSLGFMAPEILYIGTSKTIYNHKIDIFSFGALIYQMIARRNPFHNVQPLKVGAKIVAGERPLLTDLPKVQNSYYFLNCLMESCWQQEPNKRPETTHIITSLSQVIFQSIKSICSIPNRFSLRCGCNTNINSTSTISNTAENQGDLWICSDSSEGTELSVYNISTMSKLSKTFIAGNQVQCAVVCGNHVWVCTRAGIDYGVIDIFSIENHELVHNIRLRESTVSCMTSSVDNLKVYIGTLEGHCFSFDTNITAIQSHTKPQYCYVSEHAIDGIIATNKHVWIAHTYYIFFLNLDNLRVEHSYKRNPKMDAFVGHLSHGSEERIWSAHLGGCVFSGWDSINETHLFDVNIYEVTNTKVSDEIKQSDAIMTSMAPVLDTVWIGMATGHILVFHEHDLLTFFRPYTEYVRFLIPVTTKGHHESCVVVSGAKGFQSSLLDYPFVKKDKLQLDHNSGGVMIVWEGQNSLTFRQMNALQQREGLGYLEDNKIMHELINSFHFKDEGGNEATASSCNEKQDENIESQQ